LALANKHISGGDEDHDGCMSMDELPDDVYKTLWESTYHHTGATDGELCADKLATAYLYGNIHEVSSDA